jgi:hypothetical protein
VSTPPPEDPASPPVAATAPSPRKTRLKIVHGHLAFAKYPVLVGHYNGDTVAGAEAQLDRVLDSRLSQRRHLGLYPGPLGTNNVVLDETHKPPGAIVVGLGEAASLSLGGLRRTLRQGILALAAAEIDRRRALPTAAKPTKPGPMEINFSALLVGSGDGGLDRTICVTALLQAAAEAQSVFAASADLNATLTSFEVLEILEYRAFAVWHIVNRLIETQPSLGELFTCDRDVDRRSGARRRTYSARDRSWWEPIQISMSRGDDGQRSLVFAVTGGLARAEMRTIAADLDLVEPLMQRATGKDGVLVGANATPGRALFELLWPSSLKDQSAEERNRRLVLDEESAQFPWELLDDRRPWAEDSVLHNGNQRPPSVRVGLVRQLLQTRFQERVVVPTGRPKALVIGNPTGLPIPGFSALPKAEEEAAAVAQLLDETHEVTRLIGREATPEKICEYLFAEAWDIVHISAHGVVRRVMTARDGTQKPMTGVVIGDGIVLGPSVLAKMPVSPNLFFLNCCHVGRVDPGAEDQARQAAVTARQPELAASLAVQLIKNGVRAVVAAGWTVDDDVALEFARKFYNHMLDGGVFGQAVLEARQEAYDLRSEGTTWGAYQCYGEPDFSFPPACRRKIPARSDKDGNTASFVSFVEAIAAAEQIRDDVNIGLERDTHQQRHGLKRIEEEATKRSWLGKGELRVALGEARAELCDLPEAIAHYEAARSGADSQYKVKAIEQLANLRARQAVISFRNAPSTSRDIDAAAEEIAAARKLVEDLVLLLGPTMERLAIVGSCWKRLAQVRASSLCADEALIEMAEAYRKSAACVPEGAAGRSYPLLMHNAALLMTWLRCGRAEGEAARKDLLSLTKAADMEALEDFWQLIEAADAQMTAAMATGAIGTDDEATILQGYRRAWEYIGSPIKLMSVVEQFDFYEDVLGSGSVDTKPARLAIIASVQRIGGVLRQLAGIFPDSPASTTLQQRR